MKIRKKEQSVGVLGKVLNALSKSNKDTYSANYLNDRLVKVSPTEPTDGEKVWIQNSKNLLDLASFPTQTLNGVTFTNNGDGSITINGTSEIAFGVNFVKLKLRKGTYHLSLNNTTPNDFYIYNYNTNENILNKEQTGVFSQNFDNIGFDTWINQGVVFDNITIRPQVEVGDKATEFEKYVDKKIHVINNDGGYDEFINKKNMGEVVVDKLYSKNFFNKNGPLKKFVGMYGLALSNFIDETLLGKTVTLSINQVSNNIQIASQENKEIVMMARDTNKLTFVVTQELLNIANEKYLWFQINNKFVSSGDVQITYDIQCELGTERTEYVANSPIFIVESGSNSNGSWIKYSDGTMECRHQVWLYNVTFTVPLGNKFIHDQAGFKFPDFPVPFIEAPNISFTMEQNVTNNRIFGVNPTADMTKRTRPAVVHLWADTEHSTPFPDYGFLVSYVAKGRWK